MNFRPELAAKVMSGEKTVTRRMSSTNPRSPWFEDGCSLKVGRDYAVCPGRGKNQIGRVMILSTDLRPLRDIDAADVRAEGFALLTDFVRTFEQLNGGYDPDARVWRVQFAVLGSGELHSHKSGVVENATVWPGSEKPAPPGHRSQR